MLENIEAATQETLPPIEANDVDQIEANETETKTEEREYSATEREAMKQGWRPKEEYTRTDKEWVDAGEYLRAGDYMKRIHQQERRIKSMQETLQRTQEMIEKAATSARQKAIDELMQQKRDAIQSGDVDRTEQLEEQIYKHKQEVVQEQPKKGYEPQPELSEWVERNKDWFNVNTPENARMRKEAAEVEQWVREKYREDHKRDMDEVEALEETERFMRKKYSLNRGENPRKFESRSVEANTLAPSRGKKKYNPSLITAEHRKFARDFIKHGVYKTEDEYYETLQNYGIK